MPSTSFQMTHLYNCTRPLISIFVMVVRKGVSEYATYVFSEADSHNPADNIVRDIRLASHL